MCWKGGVSRPGLYANQHLNWLLKTTEWGEINNHTNLVHLGAAVYPRTSFHAMRLRPNSLIDRIVIAIAKILQYLVLFSAMFKTKI